MRLTLSTLFHFPFKRGLVDQVLSCRGCDCGRAEGGSQEGLSVVPSWPLPQGNLVVVLLGTA